MAWITKANLKGPKGDQGNPGPQGLPGVLAVDNDAAVAGYISTGGTSATKTAADTRYALKAELANAGVKVVYHLGNAAFVRPTTTAPVMWIGTVQPAGLLDGDLYFFAEPIEPPITWHTKLSARDLVLADLAAVASWADSSGNGHAAAQATGTKQPIFRTGTNPYVRFDGVDDNLKTAAFAADQTQPMTLVVAVRMTTINTTTAAKYLVDGIDVTKRVILMQRGTGAAASELWQASAGTSRNNPAGKTPVAGQWTILTLVLQGATSYFRINGVQTGFASFGANILAGLSLGADYTGAAGFAPFDLGDLRLASSALTSSQVADEETFLAARYGITL